MHARGRDWQVVLKLSYILSQKTGKVRKVSYWQIT
jgi:hypothetical protein